MSAGTKSPLQVNLRRAFVSAAAWLNSYENVSDVVHKALTGTQKHANLRTSRGAFSISSTGDMAGIEEPAQKGTMPKGGAAMHRTALGIQLKAV